MHRHQNVLSPARSTRFTFDETEICIPHGRGRSKTVYHFKESLRLYNQDLSRYERYETVIISRKARSDFEVLEMIYDLTIEQIGDSPDEDKRNSEMEIITLEYMRMVSILKLQEIDDRANVSRQSLRMKSKIKTLRAKIGKLR